ncbi:MAG: hypothetical protein WED07_03340 [Candidatus Freyarchaeum deiterrae]
MSTYWILFNPIVQSLLSLLFGLTLVAGIGLLILNLVMITLSHHRTGNLIGIAVSLILIGVSAEWQTIIPLITDIMGGISDYVALYLYQLINQWLTQNPTTYTTSLVHLLPLL